MAKSFAIVSGKGGTGKSIIAASIGYTLAHCGFRTVLVDMDLFTGGLTYYVMAERPRRSEFALRDIFTNNRDDVPNVIQITTSFVDNNLFLLPSVTGKRTKSSELHLNNSLDNLSALIDKVKAIISELSNAGYEYILVDTRGGSDITSIGTAIAAESVIIVTEADKPSWDMGHVLLDAIDDAEKDTSSMTDRIGFIINKNVLQSEAIEAFLKKEWQCSHLATIPLESDVIRCFQEDKVPVAEELGLAFSSAVIDIVDKAFKNEKWNDDQSASLEILRHHSKKNSSSLKSASEAKAKAHKLKKVIRFYSCLVLFVAYITSKMLVHESGILYAKVAPLEILAILAFISIILPDVIDTITGYNTRLK